MGSREDTLTSSLAEAVLREAWSGAREAPSGEATARVKPRLRGVSHLGAFCVSLAAGAWLIASTTHPTGTVAATIYAVSLSALLGASALYHVPEWSQAQRRWLGSLDTAMIFVLIAGTYTPFTLLGLVSFATPMLYTMWAIAAAGSLLTLVWHHMPKALSATLYIAVGWIGAIGFPSLFRSIGGLGCSLLIGGGLLYSVGAVVYAVRRPDPLPEVFGYHEIFHLFVVAAAAVHFVLIAFFVPI